MVRIRIYFTDHDAEVHKILPFRLNIDDWFFADKIITSEEDKKAFKNPEEISEDIYYCIDTGIDTDDKGFYQIVYVELRK